VREEKVLPLADAMRRMSGLPAVTLGLSGGGVLREGAYADIVVFDPATVADRATFADPHQLSAGVSQVLVNGKVTISGGAFTRGPCRTRPRRAGGTAVSGDAVMHGTRTPVHIGRSAVGSKD
jgi:N-acyl-D-aspartate/D-glutamate deacylase